MFWWKIFQGLRKVFPKMHYEPIFWVEAVVKLLFNRKADLVSPYTGEVLAWKEEPLTLRKLWRTLYEEIMTHARQHLPVWYVEIIEYLDEDLNHQKCLARVGPMHRRHAEPITRAINKADLGVSAYWGR